MTGPHDRWEELAAGYALDALEPAEEAELVRHLAECEACRRALRDHDFVAGQLGALAEDAEVSPPPWSAIRTGVVGDLAARRAQRSRRRLWLGAAAAAVAVVAATVTVVTRGGETSTRNEAVSACRAESSCHVVELRRGDRERAVVIVRAGSARLLPTDLPAPDSGRVYALWQLPSDGQPTLLAQPVVRTEPSASPLAFPYDDTMAFALSVEPAGSRATAPTTVVAVGAAST